MQERFLVIIALGVKNYLFFLLFLLVGELLRRSFHWRMADTDIKYDIFIEISNKYYRFNLK